jgi:hypothetical protein
LTETASITGDTQVTWVTAVHRLCVGWIDAFSCVEFAGAGNPASSDHEREEQK